LIITSLVQSSKYKKIIYATKANWLIRVSIQVEKIKT
jgi:hypothetical protein